MNWLEVSTSSLLELSSTTNYYQAWQFLFSLVEQNFDRNVYLPAEIANWYEAYKARQEKRNLVYLFKKYEDKTRIGEIWNFSHLSKLPFLNCIVGPVSWTYLSYQGRDYHFFGDLHRSVKVDSCDTEITLEELVLELAFGNKQQIDFYSEHPFSENRREKFSRQPEPIPGFLENFNQLLAPCLRRRKTCVLPNIHFHSIDVRRVEDEKGNCLTLTVSTLIHHQQAQFISFRKKEDFDKLEEMLNYYLSENFIKEYFLAVLFSDELDQAITTLFSNENPDFIRSYLEAFSVQRGGKVIHRIRSQLLKLEEKIRSQVITFLLREVEDKRNMLVEILELWNSFIPRFQSTAFSMSNDQLINIFQQFDVISHIINYEALLMDAYALPRMLFSQRKNIVYAGEYHILVYKKFFVEVLGCPIINTQYNKEHYIKSELLADVFLPN